MLATWFHLLRPWSYAATLVPFLAAAALSSGMAADWTRWLGGIFVGLLFQATVNLLNTWGDERSGVDDVPGTIRTTPQVHDGLVSMHAVLTAAVTCAALASVGGAILCFRVSDGAIRFNVPLLVAGMVGFLGATNYSTGVKFKYRGLGVPFVSFLMGPLETFAAAALLDPESAVRIVSDVGRFAAFAVWTLPAAALVGVIMHGNDMRDMPTDHAAGITTLASRLGPRGALTYYVICHVVPYAVCAALAMSAAREGCLRGTLFLIPFLCLPLTAMTLRVAYRAYRVDPECPKWRRLERASGGIHLLFGVLYAASTFLRLSQGEVP